MKSTIFLLVFSLLSPHIHAQNNIYTQKVSEGKTLLDQGQFAPAAKCYSEAFESSNWKGYQEDRLNAARAWSMAGVPDSAYFCLFRIAERLAYGNFQELTNDKNFQPLRADQRWTSLCALVEKNSHNYANKSKEGARFLNAAQYSESATSYTEAFKANGWVAYPHDRLNASRAWAMLGGLDSAYFHLNKIVETARLGLEEGDGEEQYFHFWEALESDTRLQPLRADPRWTGLRDRAKARLPLKADVAFQLKTILEKDQSGRVKMDSIAAQFGRDSKEMAALRNSIAEQDSLNLVYVLGLLEQYGWLGPKDVGKIGNLAIFLVVQHADLAVQEKYLPVMREALKVGNAEGADLALLEDRVLTRTGKRQLYGSQVTRDPVTQEVHFCPIEDVEHVDIRRAEMGLQPLSDYARHFGIVWDKTAMEKNKKLIPATPKKN